MDNDIFRHIVFYVYLDILLRQTYDEGAACDIDIDTIHAGEANHDVQIQCN